MRVVMENPPTILANIIHTCHVYFSSTKNVDMGCSLKLPSREPKEGVHDTLEFKDSQRSCMAYWHEHEHA